MKETFDFGGDIVWRPSRDDIERSNLYAFMQDHGLESFDALMRLSTSDVPWFTRSVLEFLDIRFAWPYSEVVDLTDGPQFPRWCVGGEMNIVTNCVDKWAADPLHRERKAFVWEGEEGTTRTLSYGDLAEEVNRCANAFRSLGLGKGDAIGLYMPMTPEIVVALLAIAKIDGGWSAFWDIANEHNKFQMFHLDADFFAAENFTAKNSVFTAAAFGLFMYLPGYAVSQNMIQRYVCSGTLAGGRGVVLLSAVINAVLGFLFLCVGTALFAFYSQTGGEGLPTAGVEIAKEDQILPYFVATQLPGVGLIGLILAGLFAAGMSTIDSGINGVSSVIVFDWMRGKQLSLTASRVLTALLGIVVIGVALFVPVLGDTVIGIITAIAGTCLGMLLGVYLLGMFVSRSNLPGVLIGLAAGVVCLAVVWIGTDIPKWWFGAFTIVPTFAVGAIASLFFDPPSAAALKDTRFLSDERDPDAN